MKPIIFSTNDVQALLNTKPGTWPAEPIDSGKPFKSQTRRILEPIEPQYKKDSVGTRERKALRARIFYDIPKDVPYLALPRYKLGDKLWVRKTFYDGDMQGKMIYRADGEYDCDGVWKPSIHMPRYAARLFLEVREVRVERLQDITEAAAKAEGVLPFNNQVLRAKSYFEELWNAINGKGAWESNPWVFVYELMRAEG